MIRVGHKTIVALGVLLASFIVAWLLLRNAPYQTYEVVIQNSLRQNASHPHSSPTGLTRNAPVTFNHVVVGHIRALHFDRKDPRKIHLLLNIDPSTPISKGTQATLNHLPQLALFDHGTDLQRLTAIDNHAYPRIAIANSQVQTHPISQPGQAPTQSQTAQPTESASTTQTTPANDPTQTALLEISAALKKQNALFETLITEESAESLKQLLYSLQQFGGVLAANSEKINTLIINTEATSKEFKPLIATAQDSMHALSTQTFPQLYKTLANMNESLDLMRELLINLNENPTIMIRGKSYSKLGPGEVVRYSNARQHR